MLHAVKIFITFNRNRMTRNGSNVCRAGNKKSGIFEKRRRSMTGTKIFRGKGDLSEQARLKDKQPTRDEYEYYESEIVGVEIVFFVSHLKKPPSFI